MFMFMFFQNYYKKAVLLATSKFVNCVLPSTMYLFHAPCRRCRNLRSAISYVISVLIPSLGIACSVVVYVIYS